MKRKLPLLTLAAFVVFIASYGFYSRMMPHGGPPHGGMMGGGPAPVDVAAAQEREVQIWHEFSGRIVAAEQAEVRPRISGMVEEILFTDGTFVEKDAPLFKIDPRPYQAAFDQAAGALAAAQAQAELAESDFARAEKLFKNKAISQRDYERRKNERDSALANQLSASAALTAARLNLDYTDVRAPIAGRAGRAEITVGNVVQAGPNAPLLTTVAADSPVYADFEMDETSFLHYIGGARADLGAIPVMLGLSTEEGTPHEGRIGSFDNRLDPRSGTIRVRAVFENADGRLIPGLFARIRIGSPQKVKAVMVSDRAVGTDQDKKFVLVVGAENKIEYRPVKPGTSADGLRIIEEGLRAGERIVLNGMQRARPGAPVMPQEVDMATGNPLVQK